MRLRPQFVDMNPDQCGNLRRVARSNPELDTVSKLLEHLGSPLPELASMWCCFAVDSRLVYQFSHLLLCSSNALAFPAHML